ncbi:HET-domain-containing protein, partial [Mytilinidion resinicola]
SAKSLNRMRGWIHECDRGHSHCKKPDSTFMPTRLLDVGIPSCKQVRLVLSTDPGSARDNYVALSHCWGPSKPLITTSANISQFQAEIPSTTLPQTFDDAIKITRLLGIRYLWIDSLCIIQDVPDDWLRESATMFSVYSNADITISASRASSSVDGFLSLDTEFASLKMRLTHPARKRSSSLAWVIQERYLSRRILLFGSAQTFWEC